MAEINDPGRLPHDILLQLRRRNRGNRTVLSQLRGRQSPAARREHRGRRSASTY